MREAHKKKQIVGWSIIAHNKSTVTLAQAMDTSWLSFLCRYGTERGTVVLVPCTYASVTCSTNVSHPSS
uniref:Uncharacterized protein n=1 Tax=Setaria italica TaxID=4555 RepID=K3ZG53_SETIT